LLLSFSSYRSEKLSQEKLENEKEKHSLKKLITVLVTSLIFQLAAVIEVEKSPIILGEKITIHSEILAEDRTFLINLPSNYEDSEENYPVLFLIQGSETLFHKETGTIRYLNEWRDKNPPMIVVNILFTNYLRDIFPVKVPRIPDTGGSDYFISFISDELIPYLEENYRISDYRILHGQSNTGMFAIYTLLANPELFDVCIAASPAVGQGDNFMFGITDSLLAVNQFKDNTLYITHALDDPLTSIVNEALPGFLEILKNKAPEGLDWYYQQYPTGGHCPPITMEDAIYYIFQDWAIPQETIDSGPVGINKYCDILENKYGIIPNLASLFNETAMNLMRSENYEKAYEFFSYLLKYSPEELLYVYQIGKIAAVTGTHIDEGIENLRIYISQENSDINPSKSAACWRLGMIYETMEEIAKAKSVYQEGLLLDKTDPYCQAALDKLETQE
jgi:predicted alpha/beta superfamily hydrolase